MLRTGDTESRTRLMNQAVELARRLNDAQTFWQVAGLWLFLMGEPEFAEERLRLASVGDRIYGLSPFKAAVLHPPG